jgi:protoporphyrinogen oxidase
MSTGTADNTIVIGAGPAGLTAAHELARRGVPVEVFEAASQVGGMARSLRLWGQTVDLGPHRFFSSDPRVNRLWFEIAGRDYDMVARLTRILYRRRLFHYPLRPLNALLNLGLREACRCAASYLRGQIFPAATVADTMTAAAGPSFEQWVTSRFGRRLFSIFFKTYSEKLWGIRCDALDADFAAQRIKKFSLGGAIKSALFGGGAKHKTLVDEFAYPHGGSGMIYERMAARIRELGGTLHLNTSVRRVLAAGGRVAGVELADGSRRAAAHVVSTFPITDLVAGLDDAPADVAAAAARLGYRNTIIVFLRVASENVFSDQWLYVHAPDLLTGRITNFRNWTPLIRAGADDTILALEYWCDDNDPLWREADAALSVLAEREIRATDLIKNAPVTGVRIERLHRSYPVYARGYKQPLAVVENYLRGIAGLTPIGRYGSFKYNNQDHSILMGLLAAENIAGGAGHDLWRINTDYEYQESSIITKTGLQPRRT